MHYDKNTRNTLCNKEGEHKIVIDKEMGGSGERYCKKENHFYYFAFDSLWRKQHLLELGKALNRSGFYDSSKKTFLPIRFINRCNTHHFVISALQSVAERLGMDDDRIKIINILKYFERN